MTWAYPLFPAVNSQQRSYLDWNASAPIRPEAREAFLDALVRFGNPSSPHAEGRAARDVLESSRERLAAALDCRPAELVFTGGGTESNNLALASLAAAASSPTFAASKIEHPSILRPLEELHGTGWNARWFGADEDGVVSVQDLEREGVSNLGFACLQAANQETGSLQPLAEFAKICGERGVPWHCDGAQAWGRIALSAGRLGAATVTLSGHKLGAPKGTGVLYVRSGTPVHPLLRGGPQERGRRAGTENIAGAAALAAALDSALEDLQADARWMAGLRQRLVAGVKDLWSGVWVNGPEEEHRRLPNTASLSFPGIDGDTLVQALDLEGVAVSAGAACTSGALTDSEVLAAMGLPDWRVKGAIRVSLGPGTAPEDVERFLTALRRVLPRLRA